jgi:hypothetical protein
MSTFPAFARANEGVPSRASAALLVSLKASRRFMVMAVTDSKIAPENT